jgi:F-type H+-transporting ATPase subunit a
MLAFLPGLHDYLRPINADINTTLGMAALMILISHLIMIRYRGFFSYVMHYAFNFSGKTVVEKFINVIVGWLHGVGELVRVLALSLRLFGNIFAGVVLIGVMIWLSGLISIGWLPVGNLFVIPFYFLEMFV